ncbi:MAG TPA: hypothetical protein VJH22_01580 [Candidatus Nanoarchaeia archaeon]|nr:hypothetical protein [Candidatus Nanoarchaeia archaeon]
MATVSSKQRGNYTMDKTVAAILVVVALVAAYLTVTNMPSSTSTGAVVAQQGSDAPTGSDVVLLGLGPDGNYKPQVLTFKQGVPTTIRNDGTLAGCALYPVQPELGLAANFAKNKEVVFTPTKKGRFPYSCSMGMMRGTIEVV